LKDGVIFFQKFFFLLFWPLLLQGLSISQGGSGTLEQTTTPMASRRIAQAVHKAEQLMAHQQEIEKKVAEQWENTHESQQPWAAQSIPAVNIDSWGTFPFVLARVMDFASGRQKLLIRGRNRFTIKQAGEALQQEVSAEALNRRLAVPKVDVLGSGKIDWSRERDRCLIITGSAVHSALDTRLKRKEDVGRVAGALARTGLPALHTVIVADGGQNGQNGGNRTTNS
jgi:Janus/Ocnus family (Ocnus)